MKKRCGCEVVLATYLTEDLDIATKELVIRGFHYWWHSFKHGVWNAWVSGWRSSLPPP